MTKHIVTRQLAYLERLKRSRRVIGFPTAMSLAIGVAEPKIDSHLLALAALPHAQGRLLDTFSGSGVVAAWLAHKVKLVDLVEISSTSAGHLRQASAAWQVPTNIFVDDVFPATSAIYDIITANPPYTDHPVCDDIERVCFDPQHRAVRRLIEGIESRLARTGFAFVSWADFADFEWLETEFRAAHLNFDIVGQLSEPSRNKDSQAITYRVYRACRMS